MESHCCGAACARQLGYRETGLKKDWTSEVQRAATAAECAGTEGLCDGVKAKQAAVASKRGQALSPRCCCRSQRIGERGCCGERLEYKFCQYADLRGPQMSRVRGWRTRWLRSLRIFVPPFLLEPTHAPAPVPGKELGQVASLCGCGLARHSPQCHYLRCLRSWLELTHVTAAVPYEEPMQDASCAGARFSDPPPPVLRGNRRGNLMR